MSHFVVLVVGDDHEEQLEPFAEDIKVPRYVRGEVSKAEIKRFVDHYAEKYPEDKKLSFDELYKKHGKDWNYGDWRKNLLTNKWEDTATWNPQGKWDWYEVGGRWDGFLLTKKGNFVNQTTVGDIDFKQAYEQSYESALEHYDEVAKAFGGVIPQPQLTIKHLAKYDAPEDKKWELIRGQYAMRKLAKVRKENPNLISIFFNFDNYKVDRETFAKNQAKSVMIPQSILINGTWYEQGQMGWFGISNDTMSDLQWAEFVRDALSKVDPDTEITVVDCHC